MFMQDITRQSATPITAAQGPVCGLLAGTSVETATGWAMIETLRIGDRLYTDDGGLRPIRAMGRHWLHPAQGLSVIVLPGGTLDNCTDLCLLPQQHLLIDLTDADRFDALAAAIPAAGLLSHPGTRCLCPRDPVEVFTPQFDEAEAIWATSGVRILCEAISGPDTYFTRLSVADTNLLFAARRAVLAA